MIAGFFKQSKPIVYVILGLTLTLLFILELIEDFSPAMNWLNILIIFLKYFSLIGCFILFDYSLKYFEIQKKHSYGAFFFVLFSSFAMPEIIDSFIIIGFLIFSFGLMRLLFLTKIENPILYIFESVFLMLLSSLFYQPFLFFTILVLVATIIFRTLQWRFIVAPILSISASIIIIQLYQLIKFDKVVGLYFFMPELNFNIHLYYSQANFYLFIIWLLSTLLCIYQILRIKKKRSLYHKQISSFFLYFLFLLFISFWLINITSAGLFILSLWPLSIYLGDFLSRLKSRLWSEFVLWGFLIIAFLNILF